jgi:glutathione peroxidase-family protein/protein-tyrosine-phosphatase
MKTVLFACVHNAGRSQMAAAWFNELADPAKASAVSAGTSPGSRVHPEVVEAMKEVGIDLSRFEPRFLSPDLAKSASLLITMGCEEACPVVPGLRREDWPLEDPKGKPVERVRGIRDEIRARVESLVQIEGWQRSSIGMTLHELAVETIDGTPKSLGDYRGNVLLIVNTASHCGFTPQYAGLEKLHLEKKGRGFRVLGFPSNDFGAQEPGTEKEIEAFCTSRYGVTFPMFSKIAVTGPNKHPLYALLTQAPPAGEVKWNFAKFLIGRDGTIVGRYDSSTTPDDPKLLADIDRALAAP